MYIAPGQGQTTPWTQNIFLNQMLHTKFQNHRPSGSEEEDFFNVFAIYSHGGHLDHVTLTIYINFHSPFPRMLHMKFGFDWPSDF